jgi:hypothetical protein
MKATFSANSAILILSLFTIACSSTSTKEHRTGGLNPYVSVKSYYKGSDGKKSLVAGIRCKLVSSANEQVYEKVSTAEQPVIFPDLTPGQYRVEVTANDENTIERNFTLPERRRVTVRINVKAGESSVKKNLKDLGEGALYVLATGGEALLLITDVALTVVEIATVVTGDGDSSHRHSEVNNESKERSRIGKRVRHQTKRIERKLR